MLPQVINGVSETKELKLWDVWGPKERFSDLTKPEFTIKAYGVMEIFLGKF